MKNLEYNKYLINDNKLFIGYNVVYCINLTVQKKYNII